ncbi:MAG: ArsA family ATPase [Polyangiales bacterium]
MLGDLRFVIVAGKGGVGKTAVSAALALSLARKGRRVLVAMCNAKDRLSHLLEVPPIGSEIRPIGPGIDAVNMDPGAALQEYGMLILKVRALSKLIFENRLVSAFLRGTPGIEAWALLGKAQYHAFETLRDGRYRYDTVIVDAPATGHGLELLRVPRVILDVVPPGLLRREAERAWDLFSDPRRAGVLIVTTPEELPANEATELYEALRDELHLPVCGLAINMVLPALFSATQVDALAALRKRVDTGSPLAQLLDASEWRVARERVQRESLTRLAQAIPAPRYELPMLFSPDLRRPEVELLSQKLDAEPPT